MASTAPTISSTAVQVGTAVGSRGLLIIHNPVGSGGNIRLGGSDVTTGLGVVVSAGDAPVVITFPASALKWYAIRDDSADVVLNVTEMPL